HKEPHNNKTRKTEEKVLEEVTDDPTEKVQTFEELVAEWVGDLFEEYKQLAANKAAKADKCAKAKSLSKNDYKQLSKSKKEICRRKDTSQ
ncbi:hypothetical protein CHS0354_036321, partial [Potamilus streckersoni]